jgi:hypothetical protein
VIDGAAPAVPARPPAPGRGERWHIDRRFVAWSLAASLAALAALGFASAIIPNPIFGRQIPPEPFAIVVWIASAVLIGPITATYLAPASPPATALAPAAGGIDEPRRSLLGYAGGVAAFLAIGCPVCNKVALVLLGTSGALSVWAPIQPLVGALSHVLLAGTLAWRLRLRARGNACAIG